MTFCSVLWFYIKIKILSIKTEFTAQNSYIYLKKNMLCHINGTVDNWLLQIQNAEKWSCAHWWEQRGSAGAFRKAAIIPTSTDEHNQSPVGLKAQTLKAALYTKELLGCCQMKKEVLGYRREMMLL